jgi:alkanesulfonate monooxygenase SsuD/methylene tetrahydromethanopterin reductase-like flavin-dependent oxidoreductase (luciferase family)
MTLIQPPPMQFSTFSLFNRRPGETLRETYDYYLELVEYTEELGFDGAWVAEHHFRDYGTCPSIMTMLGYLAGRTEKLRLGSGIMVLPLHNPIQVAEEAAQVDMLSNGRLDLGVGRGYQGIEFGGFGIDLAEARDRTNEALEMILGLWTNERFSYEGKYYSTGAEVELLPKPVQNPHPPIYVASVSPDTVEIYAKRGLPIVADPVATFTRLGKAATIWHETAQAAGHDTATARLGVLRTVYVAPTNELAHQAQLRFEEELDRTQYFNDNSAPIDQKSGQFAEGFEYWQQRYMAGGELSTDFRWERIELIGDPDRVISQVKSMQDFGYSHVICDFVGNHPLPVDEMKATLKLFAEEVIPAFR